MLESHNVKTIITAAAAMDLQVEAEQTRVVFPIADAETACI